MAAVCCTPTPGPRRTLYVREPWASKLVKGEKTSELRRTSTKVRGWVAVAVPGKRQRIGEIYIGSAEEKLVEEIDPVEVHLSREQIRAYSRDRKTLHLWRIVNCLQYQNPESFEPKQGAVVWTVDPPAVAVE